MLGPLMSYILFSALMRVVRVYDSDLESTLLIWEIVLNLILNWVGYNYLYRSSMQSASSSVRS